MARKLLSTLFLVSLFLSLSAAAPTTDRNAKCSRIRVRREVRDLSDAEWNAYVAAVKGLHNAPATRSKYSARGLSKYDELVAIHNEFSGLSHADPRFLVWHRAYLLEFEDALQAINPTVTIPYWAWAKPEDANAIEKSVVLSAKYFGSSQPGQCIPDGPFANWSTKVQQNSLGQSACVRRGLSTSRPNTERLATLSEIGSMMRQVSTFSEFSFLVEFNTHPGLHVLIGTDKSTNRFLDMATMISPNDIIFFSHHAFMDKVWHDFQLLKNVPYDGQRYLSSRSISKAVQLSDPLTPLVQRDGKPWTVGDVYDSDEICVKYLNPGDVVPAAETTTTTSSASSTSTSSATATSLSSAASTTDTTTASATATTTAESDSTTATSTTAASDSTTASSTTSTESATSSTGTSAASSASSTATSTEILSSSATATESATSTETDTTITATSTASSATTDESSSTTTASATTTSVPTPARNPIIDLGPIITPIIGGGDKPREPEPPIILPPVIRPQPEPEPEPTRPQPPVQTPVIVVPPVIRPVEPTSTRPPVVIGPTGTAVPRPPVISSITTSATAIATATASGGAKPTEPPTPAIPGIGGGDKGASLTIPTATIPAPAPTRTLVAVPDAWRQLMKLPAEAVKDAENYWNQVVKDVQAKKIALEQAGGANGGQHATGSDGTPAAGGKSPGSLDYPAPDTSEVIRELRRQQQSDAVKAGHSTAEEQSSSAAQLANGFAGSLLIAVASLLALVL
ncbi:hypothetical protein BCR44DRAFT_77045 [Catenaria anguillulae PL171]|uniref:Tyrosinase copper-binding domain-containing protein n=1 Tax=Catenaria anguillulae PL171 TaxID=765915 RepID=A0A1Y2HVF8_9FUNG|nr:hypothetical protein BCR44DRAFT_77045 [Catenaria anguillulae PL171]